MFCFFQLNLNLSITLLKKASRAWCVILLVFLAACTTISSQALTDHHLFYTSLSNDTLISRYMPVFVIENDINQYNLIGTVSAKGNVGGAEFIFIDPERATVYSEIRKFTTVKGTYTNLVYRIHFSEVPGDFIPFYIGQGRNVGLIIIVTLNQFNQPILYTTVHTCGCYLAFVPTSYMPEYAFPIHWDKARQSVYSENLPGILHYDKSSMQKEKTLIFIREGSHRVYDFALYPMNFLAKYKTSRIEIQPLQALKKLPLADNKTTSFFEEAGDRFGYVKGSYKFREWLLISWWAFDTRVGEDKVFGQDKNDGIIFYTSLKPWARAKSDMRDFAAFLNYWKWNL